MIKKLSLIITIMLLFLSCGKKEIKKIEEEKFFFGTYIKIVAYDEDEKLAKTSINEAFKEIERIDRQYNSKVEGSLVSKLNEAENKEVEFDDEGIMLLNQLTYIYNLSKGKYDVTISPLLNLWGFTEEGESSLPKDEDIKNALEEVNFEKVKIEGNNVRLEKPIKMLDTGSFLKGYALSKARQKMEANNIKSGFLTSISSIDTIGTKPQDKPWRVGLQNPNNPSEILGVVDLDGKSMGVSGDYQTYVEIDGKKYHHILDKATGYPVKDKKLVVVITEDGLMADMYSTAFFLMDTNEVMNYVNNKKDLEVLIVTDKDEIVTSENFQYQKIK
ncbi:MAG: FAD:protein FMN transferase [Cetobacterium sp.]|uniref:FAD:protein FMN transferase n=1 Tax=unclassified Cetobacterium TaxID=2630983 RepID=UPI00163BD3F3|nr:FAD:protein FMN transferase [Cetobacterium sp. 2A]MBC2856295.1 FAD:protein FMN transferase [Cetobacterium sp. 2A]